METLTVELRKLDGTSLGVILLGEKVFKSGKVGYHGQGKVLIDGERHQVQAMAVQIKASASDKSTS